MKFRCWNEFKGKEVRQKIKKLTPLVEKRLTNDGFGFVGYIIDRTAFTGKIFNGEGASRSNLHHREILMILLKSHNWKIFEVSDINKKS